MDRKVAKTTQRVPMHPFPPSSDVTSSITFRYGAFVKTKTWTLAHCYEANSRIWFSNCLSFFSSKIQPKCHMVTQLLVSSVCDHFTVFPWFFMTLTVWRVLTFGGIRQMPLGWSDDILLMSLDLCVLGEDHRGEVPFSPPHIRVFTMSPWRHWWC